MKQELIDIQQTQIQRWIEEAERNVDHLKAELADLRAKTEVCCCVCEASRVLVAR
jgi:ribosomal protein L29